jgi:hypothetical protein
LDCRAAREEPDVVDIHNIISLDSDSQILLFFGRFGIAKIHDGIYPNAAEDAGEVISLKASD